MSDRKFERILDIFSSFFIIAVRELYRSLKRGAGFVPQGPECRCMRQKGEAMKCPFCGKENTRVIDSRPADEGSAIRRRRQCDECSKRFTTYEKVETIPLVVIKKDNIREPYDRSKIESGVFRSCHKRPISVSQITALVDEVETYIFGLEEKEISSSKIGEVVMDKLKDLDDVAYVRFASVYREFKDVHTFMQEIKKILDSR